MLLLLLAFPFPIDKKRGRWAKGAWGRQCLPELRQIEREFVGSASGSNWVTTGLIVALRTWCLAIRNQANILYMLYMPYAICHMLYGEVYWAPFIRFAMPLISTFLSRAAAHHHSHLAFLSCINYRGAITVHPAPLHATPL